MPRTTPESYFPDLRTVISSWMGLPTAEASGSGGSSGGGLTSRPSDPLLAHGTDSAVASTSSQCAEAESPPTFEKLMSDFDRLANAAEGEEERNSYREAKQQISTWYEMALKSKRAKPYLNLPNLGLKELPDLAALSSPDLKTPLTKLDLSGNHLTDLAPFRSITSLKHLNVADNQIGSLQGMPDLHFLDVSRNPLCGLDGIEQSPSIARLYLDGTQISELPNNIIAALPNLTLLSVNQTSLSALPERLFECCQNLGKLYIDETQISALPENIGNLSSLETLSASKTQLKALPESLTGLQNLRYLDLRHSPLTSLSPSIHLLSHATIYLEGTDLSAEAVTELQRRLQALTDQGTLVPKLKFDSLSLKEREVMRCQYDELPLLSLDSLKELKPEEQDRLDLLGDACSIMRTTIAEDELQQPVLVRKKPPTDGAEQAKILLTGPFEFKALIESWLRSEQNLNPLTNEPFRLDEIVRLPREAVKHFLQFNEQSWDKLISLFESRWA